MVTLTFGTQFVHCLTEFDGGLSLVSVQWADWSVVWLSCEVGGGNLYQRSRDGDGDG